MHDPSCLVLEDGSRFEGRSFGINGPLAETLQPGVELAKAVGEVVFNTGMCGYHEIITDPSYTGQIVSMTYPMIGNYGSAYDWNEVGPEDSSRPKVKTAGFVVRSIYNGKIPKGRISLHQFLVENITPGIYDIDTRRLTLRLRDEGSKNGIIVTPQNGVSIQEGELRRAVEYLKSFPDMEGRNLIPLVGGDTTTVLNETGNPSFLLVDCGIKANIVKEVVARGCRVVLISSNAGFDEIVEANADAVLYSNGPGDPAVLDKQVDILRRLIGRMPVFGICLGHQLISQALGARTRKMKFGHHGVNHPVRDESTKRVFVTSQNHGFDVDPQSLPADVDVWFVNANDATIEGIKHRTLPVMTAQFHPEAAPGPHDSSWIFDEFISRVRDEVR